MKNNEKQPTYTQGEWVINCTDKLHEKYPTHFPITSQKKKVIALIPYGPNAESDVERIVKCVNMHDEFLSCLQEVVNEHDCPPYITNLAKRLIKQAEQK